LKILCTADVHIGRRSSRLPTGVDPRAHSCAQAWVRIVDSALRERVDLVLVAGDLIDRANRFFEAYGPLEAGLRRLSAAGVTTLMVAGNHDHAVLPLLVDEVASDSVRLLGRGGRWERFTFERAGIRLHVDGWSFPREHHPSSPLPEYRPGQDGAPVLALLHGDLEQPRSPYAPVSLAELRRHSGTAFVLGHVHLPREIREPGGARMLYPGSPQAMDPGERGARGVSLLEWTGSGFLSTPIPISTVRYDTLEVSVEGSVRLEEIDARIAGAVRDELQRIAMSESSVVLGRFRIRLLGATPLHRELDSRLLERSAELQVEAGGIQGSVESVEVATTTPRDLAGLRGGSGAPAVLATLVAGLEMDATDAAIERLVAEAARAARSMERATVYLDVLEEVVGSAPGDRRVRESLAHASSILLDELLGQKEDR